MGMRLGMYKDFRISSEICILVMTSAFCLLMSAKNRHFSSISLTSLNAAKFGPKYCTDHSDQANMFLGVKLSIKLKKLDFC